MRNNLDNENIIIKKILKGDTKAYSYFVSKYKDKGFSFAYSITRNSEDAEEVVQDAFLKAFKNIKKFKGRSKFSTWFYKIVINESVSKTRSNKQTLSLQDYENYNELPYYDPKEIMDIMKRKDLKSIVLQVLDKLQSKESLLLRMYYLDELSTAEIEEFTSIKKDNVRQILCRGRNNFFSIFTKMFYEESKSIVNE